MEKKNVITYIPQVDKTPGVDGSVGNNSNVPANDLICKTCGFRKGDHSFLTLYCPKFKTRNGFQYGNTKFAN